MRQCGKLVSQFWLMRNVAQFDGRQCKVRAIHSRHLKVCSTLAFCKLTGIFAGLLLVTVVPAVEIVIAHKAYGNTIAAPALELLLLAVGGEGLSCLGRERTDKDGKQMIKANYVPNAAARLKLLLKVFSLKKTKMKRKPCRKKNTGRQCAIWRWHKSPNWLGLKNFKTIKSRHAHTHTRLHMWLSVCASFAYNTNIMSGWCPRHGVLINKNAFE